MEVCMNISGRNIGVNYPPFVIAELSANHNGDIERAFKIIDAAHAAGADAVKLQTYTADTITLQSDKSDFQITQGLWRGQTLYDLYQSAQMPWSWHKPLFDYAKSLGLLIFSSPFDESAVDLLEELGAPAYKIASFEAVDIKLINYVAKTGKPMIISTGMANIDEIEAAVIAARNGGCSQLALLQCVSSYPASPADYNLACIPDLRARFGVEVGLSDHTLDNTCVVASVALGGTIIEKHVTLDRNGGGPDDTFSLEPDELKGLCDSARAAWNSIGNPSYSVSRTALIGIP